MSDQVQVGLRVDRDVYEEFKQHVKERRGRWQGVGGDELENAIRHYLHFGADKPLPDLLAEFNGRLQRIEGELGTATADGGTDAFEAEPHTHAPSWSEGDEKPPANASTDKKVAYLATQIEADVGENFGEITRTKLKDTVKDEYGFRRDTAKRYVERLVDHFELVDHPEIDPLLVTQAKRETIIEQRREELEAEADAELDEVTDR